MAPRQNRTEEVAQERRRRTAGTLDRMAQMKLAIPDSVRDENADYTLRWVNDTGNRMHFMTVEDDWSKIDNVKPVPVGTNEEGKPVYAHLCRKPKAFWEQDNAERVAATVEREKGILRAVTTDPQDTRTADVSYVPAGNQITQGYTP